MSCWTYWNLNLKIEGQTIPEELEEVLAIQFHCQLIHLRPAPLFHLELTALESLSLLNIYVHASSLVICSRALHISGSVLWQFVMSTRHEMAKMLALTFSWSLKGISNPAEEDFKHSPPGQEGGKGVSVRHDYSSDPLRTCRCFSGDDAICQGSRKNCPQGQPEWEGCGVSREKAQNPAGTVGLAPIEPMMGAECAVEHLSGHS